VLFIGATASGARTRATLPHDGLRRNLLNRLIHPFILRRKKEDVLKDV
jgi:SNF2 family DNA or RNA helicase